MKNLIFLLCLFLFISCNQTVEKIDIPAETAKIESTMNKFAKSIENRDWEQFRSVTTSDLLLNEHGLLWNSDSLIQAVEVIWKDAEISYKLDFIRSKINSNNAWLHYHNYGTAIIDTLKIDYHWMESAFFKKENDQWKIQLVHSTRLKPNSIDGK